MSKLVKRGMMMRSIFRISVIVISLYALTAGADRGTTVKVAASAETHGMIEACDCPDDPGGGLAKRSSVVKDLGKRNRFLLLDAGGFSAGGIYDSYSEGRAADSLRTILTLKGMGKIGYDAAAIGDEELQYGGQWITEKAKSAGVPLVSANCFTRSGKTVAAPWILVKKAGKNFAVTALTTAEKLFATDSSIVIGDPVKSLSRIWKEMVENSDYQIILSHLGQDMATTVADSFPECDLIVNGHRKSDRNPLFMVKTVPVMQFGFQGKSLSFAELYMKSNKLEPVNSKWLHAGPHIPDDSSILTYLRAEPVQSRPVYDLYIMSQCPYGIEALNSFVEFIKTFREIDWNIHFIGTVENDTVPGSMHGTQEAEDEMAWLAFKEIYPERWLEFLDMRSKSFVPTASILKKMNIDTVKIQGWVEKKGRKELLSHYQRSTRLGINASPTLLFNNVPVKIQITRDRLARFQCDKGKTASAECAKLPECFDDNDCKKKGKIGRCMENGKCVFQDAVPFRFTVLVADSAFWHPEHAVIAATEDLFPGAAIQIVKLGSSEGRQIANKFNPDALPFYLFSKEVKQAYNFTSIESGLVELNDHLIFKNDIVSRNYLLKRPLKKGSLVLFIDPFFHQLPFIIDNFLADSTLKKSGSIVPAIYHDPSTTDRGTENWFRMEEAARWLSIEKLYGEGYYRFLREYSKSPGSSFWPDICRRAGIDSDSLSASVLSDKTAITAHWELLKNIRVREPVLLLINNKELVTINSGKELELFLQQRNR